MNVADGSFEPVKTPKWNNYIQSEWMPDGKSILFLAREKANSPFQIWQVEYSTGKARRITNDAHDYRYLSIAPDASFLLTTQEKEFYNLWLFSMPDPSDGKQLTFSSEFKYGTDGISWTLDGKELIYTLIENVTDTNLWAINVETLEKRQITFDESQLNWYPRVTPDSNSVIFLSNRKKDFTSGRLI